MRNSDGVGFFANTKTSTKTHIVVNGKPLCGRILHQDSYFHWCSSQIVPEYVECMHCINKHRSRTRKLDTPCKSPNQEG